MSYTIKSVEDMGGDVLRIMAESADGNTVEAYGHVSATRNHFDPEMYQEYTEDEAANESTHVGTPGKHLKLDAKPRTMSAREVHDYALARVCEQHEPRQSTPIHFKAGDAGGNEASA